MPEHYDALESREPAIREREQFARLTEIVARAMMAPGWVKHLSGVNPNAVTSRAELAKLPVLRKSDISILAKGKSAVRWPQCHATRQSAAPADVAGADL